MFGWWSTLSTHARDRKKACVNKSFECVCLWEREKQREREWVYVWESRVKCVWVWNRARRAREKCVCERRRERGYKTNLGWSLHLGTQFFPHFPPLKRTHPPPPSPQVIVSKEWIKLWCDELAGKKVLLKNHKYASFIGSRS